MLGVNIYDSDPVALPETGRTAQTSFVKGFFSFFSFFLSMEKPQAVRSR